MGKPLFAIGALTFALAGAPPAAAQEGPQAGDPMRIAILVDNSRTGGAYESATIATALRPE